MWTAAVHGEYYKACFKQIKKNCLTIKPFHISYRYAMPVINIFKAPKTLGLLGSEGLVSEANYGSGTLK